MRSTGIHGFQVDRDENLVVRNFGFDPSLMQRFLTLFYPELACFWNGRDDRRRFQIDLSDMARLSFDLDHLFQDRQSERHCFRFLLNLFTVLYDRGARPTGQLPGWLRKGLAELYHLDAPLDSPRRLEATCHRSLAHISRVLKATTGRRPIDFVNDIRISRAASALVSTDKTVAAIAFENGYRSTSQFYLEFKRRMHTSPGCYRDVSV